MGGGSETALWRLVDDIYDAGHAWERWPGVLCSIADHFGARDAALGTIGPSELSWLVAPRTDPEYLACYPARFHAENHVWHRLVARGVGAAVTDQMVMDRKEFRRSIYYNEWAKPQGYRTVLGGLIDASRSHRTVLTLPGSRDYGAEQVRRFRIISKHIRRAVVLNRHFEQAQVGRSAVRRSIEYMSCAAILVDAEQRILTANAAAGTLLDAKRGLLVRKGKLYAATRAENTMLRAAITRGAMTTVDDTRTILLSAGAETVLRLSVVLLAREQRPISTGTPVALLVDVSQACAGDETTSRIDKFGLSAAEARFAAEIIKGDGKRAAAERCGISYSTARTHLSRIFEKTGVHRQAALVRLFKS